MKLGLVTYNLANQWDLDTIEHNCVEAGFTGVELRTQHAHGVEIDLNKTTRNDLRLRLDDSPIEFVGLGSTFEYDSPDENVLLEQIEGTKSYIKLAHDLGISGIKVRPNKLHENKGIDRSVTLEQIGSSLDLCANFAEDYGVQLRMEVHGNQTSDPHLMSMIMEAAPNNNATVCWNSNSTDIIGGSIDEGFALLCDRIGMVHVNELWNDYPWSRLFGLLKENCYSGYCLAEIAESNDPLRIMRYYRSLFEALGGAD